MPNYVIHVSVDGLNARAMQNAVDAGRAPTFKRLETEAAWTTNARTDFSHTITLPDHTCMLTGRPVLQPEGMPDTVYHGLTLNDGGPRGTTLHTAGNPHVPYIASVFDVVHDAGLSTGTLRLERQIRDLQADLRRDQRRAGPAWPRQDR